MESWYAYAVSALVLLGIQRFLYKVSAEKGFNTAHTTTSFMATVALLSTFLFFLQGREAGDLLTLFIIGVINSGTFLAATVFHIEALKRVPTSVAYPIIRLNLVVVVLFSLVFFRDRPSVYQVAGIVLAILVIVFLAKEAHDKEAGLKSQRRGMIYVFVSLACSAGATISSKFAALLADKLAFMALCYTISTLGSLAIRKKMEVKRAPGATRKAIWLGICMGLFNLGGFYSFLAALSSGPLSIIASITGMHFVISVALSSILYKEVINRRRLAGIVLTVLSVILLRW